MHTVRAASCSFSSEDEQGPNLWGKMLTQDQTAWANTHLQHNRRQLAAIGGVLRGEGGMTPTQPGPNNIWIITGQHWESMVRSKPYTLIHTHSPTLEKLSVQTNGLAQLDGCSGGLWTGTQVILASCVYPTLPSPTVFLAGRVFVIFPEWTGALILRTALRDLWSRRQSWKL